MCLHKELNKLDEIVEPFLFTISLWKLNKYQDFLVRRVTVVFVQMYHTDWCRGRLSHKQDSLFKKQSKETFVKYALENIDLLNWTPEDF